jgi:septal ring factor EnvC (AmiA/AmiB activator)
VRKNAPHEIIFSFTYLSWAEVYLNKIKFRVARMKKVILAVICAVFVFGTITTGYAEQDDWRGGIRSRIQESKQKIDRGVERGTLNRREARKLNKELGKILNKIDRMRADGRLSQRDRDKINRDLDRLDRDISREKRDGDRRH